MKWRDTTEDGSAWNRSGLGLVIAVAIIAIGSQSQSAQDRELCKRIVNDESGCVQMTPIRSSDF